MKVIDPPEERTWVVELTQRNVNALFYLLHNGVSHQTIDALALLQVHSCLADMADVGGDSPGLDWMTVAHVES